MERALREDLTLHLAPDNDTPRSPVATMNVAVLFVDLSGFTPLTDTRGDSVAADVLDRFSTVVRTAAAHSDGRIVKQIGDEFMLVFPTATAAVGFASTFVSERKLQNSRICAWVPTSERLCTETATTSAPLSISLPHHVRGGAR